MDCLLLGSTFVDLTNYGSKVFKFMLGICPKHVQTFCHYSPSNTPTITLYSVFTVLDVIKKSRDNIKNIEG